VYSIKASFLRNSLINTEIIFYFSIISDYQLSKTAMYYSVNYITMNHSALTINRKTLSVIYIIHCITQPNSFLHPKRKLWYKTNYSKSFLMAFIKSLCWGHLVPPKHSITFKAYDAFLFEAILLRRRFPNRNVGTANRPRYLSVRNMLNWVQYI